MAEKAKELWRCSTGESRKQNQKDGGCCYQTFLASIQILVTHENRIFQHPCITVICFVTKFPSKRKSTSYTRERKTWQWNQKTSIWRCTGISYWNMMIFHCHVSSSGGSTDFLQPGFPPGICTPSIHATVQIPSSADLRLEHWIHACAIQDISPGIVMGHTSFQDTPKGHSIQRNKKMATTSCKKSDFSFQNFISKCRICRNFSFVPDDWNNTSRWSHQKAFQSSGRTIFQVHEPALLHSCLTFKKKKTQFLTACLENPVPA